jgi:hypothetical protein
MNPNKKNKLVARVISLVMGVLAGVLLLVLAAVLQPSTVTAILHWGMIICGIFVIASNIPSLIQGIAHVNTTMGVVDLVSSILGILLGLALIFYQGTVLVVCIGVYMILFPLLRIILASDRRAQWGREWLRLLLGVVLLVFLPVLIDAAFTALHVLLLVLGWAIIALSVVCGILGIVLIIATPAPSSSSKGKRTYVDYDGDGKIDDVFEDGDGR